VAQKLKEVECKMASNDRLLPPEQFHIKRRREEEPVDTLCKFTLPHALHMTMYTFLYTGKKLKSMLFSSRYRHALTSR
jgi:hypothetical protein